MNISKSRINTFERCQMLFRFLYIDKLEGEETDKMSEGTSFHEWSDKLEKNLKNLKDESTIREYLNTLLRNPTRSEWEKYYINFLLNLLGRCVSEKKEKWREYFHPIYTEFKFETEIDGNKYRCIPDRMYKSFDDNFIISEIKTGIATLEDVRKELCISKIIVDKVLNVNCKYFGIINPKLQITSTEEAKKISMTYARKSIDKFIVAVNKGEFKKNTENCGFCKFASVCYEFSMFK